MFCSKCGNELEEGAKFCPSCGSEQQETAAPDVTSRTTPVTGKGGLKIGEMFKDLTNAQVIGLVGFAFMLIGAFLPIYTIKIELFGYSESQSQLYIETALGVFTLLSALGGAALIIIKKQLYSAAALALIFIFWISKLVTKPNTYGMGKMGFGFYVVLIGMLVHGVSLYFTLKEDSIIK